MGWRILFKAYIKHVLGFVTVTEKSRSGHLKHFSKNDKQTLSRSLTSEDCGGPSQYMLLYLQFSAPSSLLWVCLYLVKSLYAWSPR